MRELPMRSMRDLHGFIMERAEVFSGSTSEQCLAGLPFLVCVMGNGGGIVVASLSEHLAFRVGDGIRLSSRSVLRRTVPSFSKLAGILDPLIGGDVGE